MNGRVKLAFSGRMRSGKDYVADQLGLTKLGFADPMYGVAQRLVGSSDKNVPGMRDLLRYIGQVGWGHFDGDRYRATVERGLLCDWCRRNGFQASQMGTPEMWQSFGLRKTFWVDILLERIRLLEYSDREIPGFAVVNVRFDHELEPLREAGFDHYHIVCREETRRMRMGSEDRKTVDDKSEEMAARFDVELFPEKKIWNDDGEPPEAGMLSVEQLAEKLKVHT